MNLCLFDLDTPSCRSTPITSSANSSSARVWPTRFSTAKPTMASISSTAKGTLVLADLHSLYHQRGARCHIPSNKGLQQAFMDQVIYPAMQPKPLNWWNAIVPRAT